MVLLKNEDGVVTIPDTFKWSLTDSDGNIVNSLEDIEIEELGQVQTVFLYGDDLQMVSGTGSNRMRRLLIEATYTSDFGIGLPVNDEYIFYVKDLLYIT